MTSADIQGGEPQHDVRQARRAGITAFVGTTIEWFDFYIYGTASALVLGRLFFPDASPAIATLAAFATFAVGFVARPLGGIIFGHFGDKVGRKNAVIFTLMLMGAGTVGVGLLPTYATIGVWAPILLVLLRVLQGIAMGGEWGGAVLIATEFAPERKKVLYGAFAQQGSPVGNLLATLAFLGLTAMSDSVFETWGWRLPFLGSAVLIAIALYIRLRSLRPPRCARRWKSRTQAHPTCRGAQLAPARGSARGRRGGRRRRHHLHQDDVRTRLGHHRPGLRPQRIPVSHHDLAGGAGASAALRRGPRNTNRAQAGGVVDARPRIRAAADDVRAGADRLDPLAILGMALATAPHAMYYSALAGILAQRFPTHVRYTGISISYQLSTALFAGTAPMVSQFLLTRTGSIWPVVGLGLGYVALSLICMQLLLRDRRGASARSITDEPAFA